MRWLGERPGPFIDNLNAGERQGWIADAAAWLELRRIRNQMIHEYVEDLTVLVDALNTAHEGVPLLSAAASAMRAEIARRGAMG